MRTLVKEAGARHCQLKKINVCIYTRALKGGQRWNRRGWQEIIKRLIENKCLESRIKNNSMEVEKETWRDETALLARGGAGTSFCSKLLQLCRQELSDFSENTGVTPKRKHRSGQLASACFPRSEIKTPRSHGSSAINKYVQHLLAYNPYLCNTLSVIYKLFSVCYP